jgi:hypothetical protein
MVETKQLIWLPAFNTWQEQLISTISTAPILNQSLYISKTGSDDTGNGSINSPFLTIAWALSFISSPSANVRYTIYVAPGEYADPFSIRPWTSIIGAYAGSNGVTPDGAMLVEITAPADTCGFSADWATSRYSVGFMSGLGFQNHQTWDQASHPGMQPQLNFQSCSFNSGASFLGPGTVGFDNVTWDDCLSYGGVTVQGWQVLWTRNCVFLGGNVDINAGPPGATEDTTWLSQGDSVGTNFSSTNVTLFQDGYNPHYAKADLSNTSVVGNLTINGVLTSYSSTMEGIPCPVMLLNGAQSPILVSCATGLAYDPLDDGYWVTPPTSVSNALDQLAAKSSGGSSKDYALFFALMPGDNSATVAVGAAVQFPQNGPTSGVIARTGPSTFNLPNVGTYEVTWQASISEPGQLQLAIGGVGLPNTVVGRATGTSQLVGSTIITTSVPNSVLSVINPVGNSTALTVTPIAGGTNSVSATLTIKAL